ncbi:MAG: DUF983 domain-containing protein [Rhodospirillales bacterium]|nr:DUF983 domain-containing protein [Rhodospirillales bacterium]
MTQPPPRPSLGQTLARGLRCRCPRCGQGRLFDGFLTVTAHCRTCGLGFGGHDAGDGPAVFAIFILGFGVVGIAAAVEVAYAPPLWVHAVLWTPLILGGGLLLLRPLKGLMIALQHHYRSVDEPQQLGGT